MLHPGVPVMWYGHIRDLSPTAEGCMGGRLPNVTLLHWAQQKYALVGSDVFSSRNMLSTLGPHAILHQTNVSFWMTFALHWSLLGSRCADVRCLHRHVDGPFSGFADAQLDSGCCCVLAVTGRDRGLPVLVFFSIIFPQCSFLLENGSKRCHGE